MELVKERGARHDRDSARERHLDETSRKPSGVDRSRDEDVRVEDDPEHLGGGPAGSLGSQSPQLFNGECHRLFLRDRHVACRLRFRNLCEDGETTKPEVAAKGLLNNLCFKPPLCPSSATQCVENPLIEFDRRRPARHPDKCRSVTRTRSRPRGSAWRPRLGVGGRSLAAEVEPVPMFRFTLTVQGADLLTNDGRRALLGAGCNDATVERVGPLQLVHFDREADCFADAVGSGIRFVESVVPGARVVEVRRDDSSERSDASGGLSSDLRESAGILAEHDYPHWRDTESIQQWVRAVRRGGLPEQGST